MKLSWILFGTVLILGVFTQCQAFDSAKFQDFVDKFIDVEKFKQEGLRSLNSTAWEHIWKVFKAKFQRHYNSSDEEKTRIKLFRERMKGVLNSNFNRTNLFRLSLNKFSDWTQEELDGFRKALRVKERNTQSPSRRRFEKFFEEFQKLSRAKRNTHSKRKSFQYAIPDRFANLHAKRSDDDDDDDDDDNDELPQDFDWRTRNVVGPVKDQGRCGSCYAFASTEVFESIYAIKTGAEDVPVFSPQQIVDCSGDYGNYGCNGGNFEPTVDYLQSQSNKIATEDSYPYSGSAETCQESYIDQVDLGTITWGQIPDGDEQRLAKELVKNGPVFIGLDVESDLFMQYSSGVLSIPNCPNQPQDMDHALVAVGYGYDEESGKSYWIIRNSWGADWGENGYLRLEKDAGGMCGITTMAYFATLDD